MNSPVKGVEKSKELNERFPELEFAVKEDDGRGRVEDDADGAERGDDVSSDNHLHVGQPGWVLHHPGRAGGRGVVGGG